MYKRDQITLASIDSFLLDSAHGKREPTLALDKQITQATVVRNPCGQDTKSTACLVDGNIARPGTDSKKQEGERQEEEQCNEADVATEGTNAVTKFQNTNALRRVRGLTEA